MPNAERSTGNGERRTLSSLEFQVPGCRVPNRPPSERLGVQEHTRPACKSPEVKAGILEVSRRPTSLHGRPQMLETPLNPSTCTRDAYAPCGNPELRMLLTLRRRNSRELQNGSLYARAIERPICRCLDNNLTPLPGYLPPHRGADPPYRH
jgi:hypothetical protein